MFTTVPGVTMSLTNAEIIKTAALQLAVDESPDDAALFKSVPALALPSP
jgi:hypothetical protein